MKMINSNQLLKNLNISRSLCDSNNVTNITVSITSVGTVFKTIESAPTYFIETVFFRACYVSSNMLHSLKYLQRNFLEISSIKRTILRFQSNSSYPKGSLQKKKTAYFRNCSKFPQTPPPPRLIWNSKVWTLQIFPDPSPPCLSLELLFVCQQLKMCLELYN